MEENSIQTIIQLVFAKEDTNGILIYQYVIEIVQLILIQQEIIKIRQRENATVKMDIHGILQPFFAKKF